MFFSYEEIAQIADVSVNTVRYWAVQRRFPVVRVGRRSRVRVADVAVFLGVDVSELAVP